MPTYLPLALIAPLHVLMLDSDGCGNAVRGDGFGCGDGYGDGDGLGCGDGNCYGNGYGRDDNYGIA